MYMCVCVYVCVCVCMYVCMYVEVNNGKEFDSMEKTEKRCNPKVMNLLRRKFDVQMFRFK